MKTLLIAAAVLLASALPARAQAGGTQVSVNVNITTPGIIAEGTLSPTFEGATYSYSVKAGPGTHILIRVEWCDAMHFDCTDTANWNDASNCSMDGDYIHVPFSFPVVYQMPLTEATSGCSGPAGPALAGMKVRLNAAEVTGNNLLTVVGFE